MIPTTLRNETQALKRRSISILLVMLVSLQMSVVMMIATAGKSSAFLFSTCRRVPFTPSSHRNIVNQFSVKRSLTALSFNRDVSTVAVRKSSQKGHSLPSFCTRLFSGSDAMASESPKTIRTLAKYSDESSICNGYEVYEWEQTIKKSRFIGLARYADDWKDASEFVQDIRKNLHPKARHWCFAYRGSIVSGGETESDCTGETSSTITERASDDGEPSGTAGQPILNALRTETDADGGLVDVVVVVIRYSGGIKLGAGGLIRAYGGTARSVLQEHTDAQVDVIPKIQLQLSSIQPKHVGVVYELAAKYGGSVEATSEDYTSFSITCDFDASSKLSEQLLDATRGSAVIR